MYLVVFLIVFLFIALIAVVVVMLVRSTSTGAPVPPPADMNYMNMPHIPSGLFFRSRWIAVRTPDGEKVVSMLGLTDIARVSWRKGVATAAQGAIFIAPEVEKWTVLCGMGLPAPDSMENLQKIRQLLIRFSSELGEAQYFCSDLGREMHCWMRAEQGVVTRIYSLNLKQGRKAYEEGERTPAELPFLAIMEDSVANASPGAAPPMARETAVMNLAQSWSTSFVGLSAKLDNFKTFGWQGKLPG